MKNNIQVTDSRTTSNATTTDTTSMISINADVFIIPNPLAKVDDFSLQSSKESALMIENDNGIEHGDGNKFVQVWITRDDADNMCRHGFLIDNIYYRFTTEYIPLSIFEGKKEGDVVTVIMEALDEKRGKSKVEVNLTLNQTSYRYRNFGPFEEVINKLKVN